MLPNWEEPSVVINFTILALAAIYALWKGGAPERCGAGVMLAMLVFQFTAYSQTRPILAELDIVSVTADIMAFVGFGAIALNARRIWPIFAASLQLVSIFSHFARLVEGTFDGEAYAILKAGPTLIVLLLLISGTALHRVRLKKYASEPSWVAWGLNSKTPILVTSQRKGDV